VYCAHIVADPRTNSSAVEVAYSFKADWYDSLAQLTRHFIITFFQIDQTIEIYDCKQRRIFLKRCHYPSIKLYDLVIGNQVSIYNRQFTIVDAADEFTRQQLTEKQEPTLILCEYRVLPQLGDIVNKITLSNKQQSDELSTLRITRMKSILLTEEQLDQYCISHPTDSNNRKDYSAVLIEVIGKDSKHRINDIIKAFQLGDALHISKDSTLFNSPSTATFNNSTVVVVKPHILQSNDLGPVLKQLSSQLIKQQVTISAIEMFNLSRSSVEEFLEVYKGVLPEYSALCEQMSSGTCCALEISPIDTNSNPVIPTSDQSVVNRVRELCGCYDPEIARVLRKDSLSAQFGINRVKNAVHATDLEEDGILEVC